MSDQDLRRTSCLTAEQYDDLMQRLKNAADRLVDMAEDDYAADGFAEGDRRVAKASGLNLARDYLRSYGTTEQPLDT